MSSGIKIGKVSLGHLPRVVLVVDRDSNALDKASQQGVALIEARVDLFNNLGEAVNELKGLKQHGLPLIGTIRHTKEGGKAPLPLKERAALYEKILPWVNAIDIEIAFAKGLRSVILKAHKQKKKVILSYHNFKQTPSNTMLANKLSQAKSLGADITKIAVHAQKGADVLKMYDFTLKHKRRKIITISMGPKGTLSRALFPSAGSLLTYTSLIPFDGQMSLRQLVRAVGLIQKVSL